MHTNARQLLGGVSQLRGLFRLFVESMVGLGVVGPV
jgi:hypothetical protein